MPAFAATMSMRPSRSSTFAAIASIAARSTTSAWTASAQPPADLSDSAARSAEAMSTSTTITRACSAASTSAIPWPTPLAAPVTTATRPSRLCIARPLLTGPLSSPVGWRSGGRRVKHPEETMTETPVSRAITERGVAVGAMLYEFDTPRVMRILASAGVDFALFDLEHTAWDAGTLRTLYATGLGTGVYPIPRVVRAQYALIATALDAGSRGIMAPMVESADEARLLVESAKFPPVGRRGFGVIMRDELEGGPAAMAERGNSENLVIAQIESPAGIENADAIVSVPGVDAVWLGQFDLSLALGIPGEFA